MRNELLNIADYIEALEQRITTLEARINTLENRLEDRVEEQANAIIALENRLTDLSMSEVEVDIEEDAPEEPEPLPVVEEEPLPFVDVEPEPAPVRPQPARQEPVRPAPVRQEPVRQEPPKPQPQQGSLFGSTVTDLRHAISLGDRFLFQRELFSQNGEIMQMTLDVLNKQPNFDAAIAYIDKHFSWDKESPTYELFINALHRRFG